MYSLRQLAKHGLVSAVLVLSLGATASFADDHGPSYDDVTFGGHMRVRGNYFDFDNSNESSFTEQRTELSAHAAFSHNVAAYLSLYSYGAWGDEDAVTRDGDVTFYQGYFDVGSDTRLRVGRQELVFGNEWLLGNNDSNSLYSGLSYDGVRVTHTSGDLQADLFATTLAEGFEGFAESDANLIGAYFSYAWCEESSIDAYFLWLRDDTGLLEPIADQFDLYTAGARAGGVNGGIDYEAEIAFQFGQVEAVGGDVDFGGLGINAELGYTFDSSINPRMYFNYAYISGNDDDDIGFIRLFSDIEYSMFDPLATLSNVHAFIWGVSVDPAENLTTGVDIKYFLVDEELGGDDDLGIELHLHADYRYTDFLNFRAGWAWFDVGDAAGQGNVIGDNFLAGGIADDSFNYLYLESTLSF